MVRDPSRVDVCQPACLDVQTPASCRCIGVVVLYTIAFRVFNALALKFLNFRECFLLL